MLKKFFAVILVFSLVVSTSAYAFNNQVYHNPAPQEVETNTVKVNKSITQVSSDVFDIDLDVDISNRFQMFSQPGISVVLVLDVSSSMNNNFSDSKTRAKALEEACSDFLDIFLSDTASGDNEIAVVAYDNEIYTTGSFGFNVGAKNKDLTAAKAATINAIAPGTNGATNIQLGIKTARDYLKTASNKNKYMILFSDGAPNMAYNGVSGKTTTQITPLHGYNFDFYVDNFGAYLPYTGSYTILGNVINDVDTAAMLGTISESLISRNEYDIGLFSIFIYGNATSQAEKNKAEFVMQNMANTPNDFFEADNVKGLTDAFEKIANELIEDTSVLLIEDPMGYGINFDKILSVNGQDGSDFLGIEYEKDLNTLICNFSNITIPAINISDGSYTQRYTINYRVTLDTAFLKANDKTFSYNKPYVTNNETKLFYYLFDGAPYDEAKLKNFSIDVPSVFALNQTIIEDKKETNKELPDTADNNNLLLVIFILSNSLFFTIKLIKNKKRA